MNDRLTVQRLWTPWLDRCPLLLHRAHRAHGPGRHALLRAWMQSRRDGAPFIARVSAP